MEVTEQRWVYQMHHSCRDKAISLITAADFHKEKKNLSRHGIPPLSSALLTQHQGSDAVGAPSKAVSLS